MSKIRFRAISISHEDTTVPPTIDIVERITMLPLERREISFDYYTGDPYAILFLIEWYRYEWEAEARRNPLTAGIPTTQFIPIKPARLPNTDQVGILDLWAPYVEVSTELWCNLIIANTTRLERIVTQLDSKDEDLDSADTKRRPPTYPTWER